MLIPKTNKRGTKRRSKKRSLRASGSKKEQAARRRQAKRNYPATVAQTEARNANSILARTFFRLDCSTNTLDEVLRMTWKKDDNVVGLVERLWL